MKHGPNVTSLRPPKRNQAPVASIGHVWTVSLTWPKRDIHKGKGSLASPPHITFGPRFLPRLNVTHAAKLTL
ncbi:hypothetical protein PIB30_104562, partial [Stylosanthes scabra]|nr:hypothetical protein [Stylosanthes scabra]